MDTEGSRPTTHASLTLFPTEGRRSMPVASVDVKKKIYEIVYLLSKAIVLSLSLIKDHVVSTRDDSDVHFTGDQTDVTSLEEGLLNQAGPSGTRIPQPIPRVSRDELDQRGNELVVNDKR